MTFEPSAFSLKDTDSHLEAPAHSQTSVSQSSTSFDSQVGANNGDTDTQYLALLRSLESSATPAATPASVAHQTLDLSDQNVIAGVWALWESLSPEEKEDAARKCYGSEGGPVSGVAVAGPGPSTLANMSAAKASPIPTTTAWPRTSWTPGCSVIDPWVRKVPCAWLDSRGVKCSIDVEATSTAILAHVQGYHAPPGVIVDLHKDFGCRWGDCHRKPSMKNTVADHIMQVHVKADAQRRVCSAPSCITYLKSFEDGQCAVCVFRKKQLLGTLR